jgi:hypothetical protein
MSSLANAMILNAVILAVVLEADLGRHRKISWFRVARPLISACFIIPFFIKGFTSHGQGLLLELAATLAGLLLGLAAVALMGVYRSARTSKPVSQAGLGYAGLWTAVIGARVAFSYGSVHWFGPQLGHWMTVNSITSNAITDSLIFMAIAMMITRSLGLAIRARKLPNPVTASTETAGYARP